MRQVTIVRTKKPQGGLSRNKVAVRERAAGSPPIFYFTQVK